MSLFGASSLVYYQLILTAILVIVGLNMIANLHMLSRAAPQQDHVLLRQSLSVLIPARNEAHNIGRCLQSLLDQDYPITEILVLNDNSSDDTAAIVTRIARQDARVRMVSGEMLPQGWMGKNYACHQLAELATGNWLLFTDADTDHQPGARTSGVVHAVVSRFSRRHRRCGQGRQAPAGVFRPGPGRPYCARLMRTNFTQRSIVDKTRKHFVVIAINIWGDLEVTWLDGTRMSEKAFAKLLKIQFTPTQIFFDEKGNVALRLNGYYPPRRFEAALDYVAGRMAPKLAFRDYLASAVMDEASAMLHPEPFFIASPPDLTRRAGGKPLAVVFETPYCAGCDEMHREGFRRPEVEVELAKFDVARLALGERTPITTPDGKATPADAWMRSLKLVYTPSIVFFDATGHEVFRTEAYLRPFHLAGSFAYVSSGAYAKEPSFQRFLRGRAERMQKQGKTVDLWK